MEPTQKDIMWARHHGWDWDGKKFHPIRTVEVIRNPLGEGWVIWLSPIGAVQTDAPWSNPRAALRCAETIRRQKPLRLGEMNCAEED